jgi:hypothetical protein
MKKRILYGIIILVFGLIYTACNFSPPDIKPTTSNTDEFDRHDNLALMKKLENHKIDMNEMKLIVEKTLNKTQERRSVSPSEIVITEVKKLPMEEQRFTSFNGGRSVAVDEEPVAVYEFTIGSQENDNEMFALVCDDIRIGTVLAVADGTFDDGPEGFIDIFKTGLHNYIATTILEYDSITEEEVANAFENALTRLPEESRTISGGTILESDFTIGKSPMLITRWGQGTREGWSGYVYNNYVQYAYNNFDFITGCVPTAIAQIIAFHNYIIPFGSLPKAFVNTDYGTWTGTFNLSQIRNMESIKYSNRNNPGMMEAIGQVGMLMYHIGKKGIGNATYENGSTKMSMSKAYLAFETLGYRITNYISNPTTTTGTIDSFNIKYKTSPNTIKDALNDNLPILFDGYSQREATKAGHCWVIDGWANMTYYREVRTDGNIWYVLLNNILMVHCNLGWNGKSDGWYIYGIFDTSNTYFPNSPIRTILEGDHNYSMDTDILIPMKKMMEE